MSNPHNPHGRGTMNARDNLQSKKKSRSPSISVNEQAGGTVSLTSWDTREESMSKKPKVEPGKRQCTGSGTGSVQNGGVALQSGPAPKPPSIMRLMQYDMNETLNSEEDDEVPDVDLTRLSLVFLEAFDEDLLPAGWFEGEVAATLFLLDVDLTKERIAMMFCYMGMSTDEIVSCLLVGMR
ncbi:hypothetical protein BGZ51_001234 [Haplosporangium sp. Z 767]|nr:hypothetical protein BGZ50_002207 [Haplosporangium sp. Z 11]KAF9187519.1 hypothetical protein BGZ51_001234 [Haplosporangium sp. Z 767]